MSSYWGDARDGLQVLAVYRLDQSLHLEVMIETLEMEEITRQSPQPVFRNTFTHSPFAVNKTIQKDKRECRKLESTVKQLNRLGRTCHKLDFLKCKMKPLADEAWPDNKMPFGR